jgi:hypothetical protein
MTKLQLKAILAGVSTDKTRPHICGVLYKKSRLTEDSFKIELVSTDGHVLFHLTFDEGSAELIPEDFQPQSCIIPAETIKIAIAAQTWKTLPKEKQIRVSDDLKELIVDDTLRFPFTSGDIEFPKWENVMVKPTNDGYLGTIGVNVMKQVIEFSKVADSKMAGISLWLGKGKYGKRKLGETAYAVRICRLFPADSAEIVIMPLRDEDAEIRYPDKEKCLTCRFNHPAHTDDEGEDIPDLCSKVTICEWEPIQDEPVAIINNHDA